MRSKNLLILIFLLTFSLTLIGQENDSIKSYKYNRFEKLNLNPSFTIGSEFTLSSRIEYENSKWGKINLKGEVGLTEGGLLLDIGLGYGYPILCKGNNVMFANGNITYTNIGLKSILYGPTGLIEFEYRKTWKNFSLNIAPFYRRKFIENPSVGISYNKNSFGIRFGLMYSFSLIKK